MLKAFCVMLLNHTYFTRTAVSFGSESCSFTLEFPCNSTEQHPVSLHVDCDLSVALASFTPRKEISKKIVFCGLQQDVCA